MMVWMFLTLKNMFDNLQIEVMKMNNNQSIYGHRGVAKSGIMSESAEKLGLKKVTINAESEETKALQEILSKIDQEDNESLDGY